MRPHARPSTTRRGRRSLTLAILWGGILTASLGLGVAGYSLADRSVDSLATCLRGGPVIASTVIIVDASDPLSEVQQRRLRAGAELERDRLPRGGRLAILKLNPAAGSEPDELASVCSPGSPEDADPLFQTVSRAAKAYQAGFAKPIDDAVTAASEGPAAGDSPILETLAAALTRPDFDARTPDRRLLIVSDMLQHETSGYSQLKSGDVRKAFAGSALARQVTLDLRGVVVAIDYLQRPAYASIQGERHRDFWRRLLLGAGATAVDFVGLPPSRDASADVDAAMPERADVKGSRRSRPVAAGAPRTKATGKQATRSANPASKRTSLGAAPAAKANRP